MHKYFLWLILTCCAITKGWGQYNEIGVFFGGVNPIADIGSTYYVFPTKPAIGLLYKRNVCISIPMSLLSFFLPLMYIQASIISRWIDCILTILPPLVSMLSIRPIQSVMNHGQYLLPWESRLAYGDPAS